jgi:hypothetical protein
MNWARVREAIGRLWGATTTLVLSIGVAVLPILQGIDPDVVHAHPALMWAILLLGVGVTVLRVIAPPPPAVPIHIDDAVEVDHLTGTVTVTKATAIPAGVVNKAAGEKS